MQIKFDFFFKKHDSETQSQQEPGVLSFEFEMSNLLLRHMTEGGRSCVQTVGVDVILTDNVPPEHKSRQHK